MRLLPTRMRRALAATAMLAMTGGLGGGVSNGVGDFDQIDTNVVR